MRHWLFKSEPHAYNFDQLRADNVTSWSGVRNYQARNNMIAMRAGDLGFFYHSSIAEPCVVGICKVVVAAHVDITAFARDGDSYDARSTPERPLWQMVDVAYERAFAHPVTLARMRDDPRLVGMALLSKGSRLSVQPVTAQEWKIVLALSKR